MAVMQLQVVFLCVIFATATTVGLAPVLLPKTLARRLISRAATRNRLLSCASCFGAGVFLFVCFMGLLPEADRKFHHFLEELSGRDERWEEFSKFPWGFFVVTCGFLVIFTIDKLVHAIEDSRKVRSISVPPPLHLLPSTPGPILHSSKHTDIDHTGSHGVPSSAIFLVALGLHTVFEGVAVGLQTEVDRALEFALAVLVHEPVMALTFGLEVSNNQVLSRTKKVMYVLAFTSTIPLGIAVGVALQNTDSHSMEIVSAVLEAFATGIFLHVIFIEVLAKEFPDHSHDHHNYHNNHYDYPINHNHNTCNQTIESNHNASPTDNGATKKQEGSQHNQETTITVNHNHDANYHNQEDTNHNHDASYHNQEDTNHNHDASYHNQEDTNHKNDASYHNQEDNYHNNHPTTASPTSIYLILEKIMFICGGIGVMILLNTFLHADH